MSEIASGEDAKKLLPGRSVLRPTRSLRRYQFDPNSGRSFLEQEAFGSELIKPRVPDALCGKGSLEMGMGGIKVRIEFRSKPISSILETGMPERLK